MRDISTQVRTALSAAGVSWTAGYPACIVGLPAVTVRESALRCYRRADGNEALTECEYTVDMYAAGAEENRACAETVDTALTALGLRRVNSVELYDSDIHAAHRVAVYSGVLDTEGNVYQG